MRLERREDDEIFAEDADLRYLEPTGAGGTPIGHLVRHVHVPTAPKVGGQPFIGGARLLEALRNLRRAAPQRKNELKSGDFGGSVLTLSATLRTWEARGPSNSATADTMG